MESVESGIAEPGPPGARPPSASARRAVVWMPIIACLVLGALGLYPGSVFSSSCFTPLMVGGLGLGGAIIWIRAVIRTKTRWWVALLLATAVIGTGEAANYYLVAKAAFPLFRSAFEERARRIQPGERLQNERIAIYMIEEVAADGRGGVYFMVSSGGFIDRFFRGFAYRANSEGTPWGNDFYWLNPIDGEWSIFSGARKFN